MHPDHELNRAAWDELAEIHGQDAYYDSDALVAGASSLIEEEQVALAAAVGSGLSNKRVLHFQCHLGFDAITLARGGAQVTGLDFSPAVLRKAEALATRCGLNIEWVCADAVDLPEDLAAKFDLVWATMGVLCWIVDVRAWMRSVARALVPGGRLVLIDGYPGEQAPDLADQPQSGRPGRRYLESGWDYATPSRTGPQAQFSHSLRSIAAAAEMAGLRVVELHEHASASHHLCIKDLEREPDGRYRKRVAGEACVVLYTMIAERSAT
jgi:SAM-dependent methyltransferase